VSNRTKRRRSREAIIAKLRAAEVLLSPAKTVAQASKTREISEKTYFRWRREYGGMNKTQATRLLERGKENIPLKKLVADISLDNASLKEVLSTPNVGRRQKQFRPIGCAGPSCSPFGSWM